MESPAFGWDPYPEPTGAGRHRDDMRPFWVKPDGSLMMLHPGHPYDDILAADPRLGPPSTEDDWHMGKLADLRNQDRVINQTGPPTIIGAEHPDATPEAIARDDYLSRRPFIYHAPTHTVYVGRPGEHHAQVIAEHQIPYDEDTSYDGYVSKGYQDAEEPLPDHAAWHYLVPSNHQEVLDAVGNQFGVPADHAQQGLWNFTAAEDPTDAIMEMLGPLVRTLDKHEPINPELQRIRDERKADPLGYEMRNDWDREGDVSRGHPDIEWVPTHVMKKFIEYDRRPGGRDAWSSPERWNALGQHIKQNGFKNPAWLDFNPDTGMAHLSEGNHRVQIAVDHGMPAIPVRVYRSTRNSPTQIPVKAQPQPEWEDSFDPTGYHWPQYMRPSHLGLPTVPPPDQRQAAFGYGDYGKKWAWIDGQEPRFWTDRETGNGGWETQPHYQTLLDMARDDPRFRGKTRDMAWSNYDDVTKAFDQSGVKWALGTMDPEGAYVSIHHPHATEEEISQAIGQPVTRNFQSPQGRRPGDENAYDVTRTWHF